MSKGGNKAAKQAAQAQIEATNRAIAEQRRQFGITEENLNPFIAAGTAALPGFAAGTTPQGLDAQLGQIFGSENFQNLRDERTTALEGQLAAGGLTRSGTALQEAANVPTQLGFDLENMLFGRTAGLAGLGQESALGLGGLGQQSSGAISGLLQQQGISQGQGILGGQQAQSAGIGQAIGAATGLASIFFSDPRLKENAREISHINDLTVWEWDWIPEAKGTIVWDCSNIGFMADEVKEKYPHHTSEFGSFMTVNYPALLNELEAANGIAS